MPLPATTEVPEQLPLGSIQYALTEHAVNIPPNQLTVKDAEAFLRRVVMARILGHHLV